jgi:hypothetical protein
MKNANKLIGIIALAAVIGFSMAACGGGGGGGGNPSAGQPTKPAITTTSLPGGVVGTPYSQSLAASGTTPITWIKSGDLPNGLTLSPEGVISGTPATEGTFDFTVKATNSVGDSDPKALSIVITLTAVTPPATAAPTITNTLLPGGIVGTAYSQTLTAHGTAPITWSIESGALPAGLTLSADGVISGTPTAVGTANFTVKAANSEGSGTKALSIDITLTAVAPTIITTTLPDGVYFTDYSEQQLEASGTAPITWSIVSGTLPTGFRLSPAGIISGSTAISGTHNFTVKATNSEGSDTKALSIFIPTPVAPTITTTSLPGGFIGTAYSQTLTATGTAPFTWSISSGALPAGLELSTAGVISGTPTAAGTFNFTVRAENVLTITTGNYGFKNLSIVIITPAAPSITTTTLPGGFIGTAYSQTLTASGTAPITWSLDSGALPTGLTLSAAGVISGTPTTAGTYNFTVKATNSVGSNQKALSIVIDTTLGAKWTAVTNSTFGTITINAIAYGGGKFVAVGGGEGAYSSDGINWTPISGTIPSNAIAYGGNKFVAVGNAGAMAYSSDGINWTAITGTNNPFIYNYGGTPASSRINAIAYGGSTWVAGGIGDSGGNNAIAYSHDGVAWTIVSGVLNPFGGKSILGIAYGGNKFVAGTVGDMSTSYSKMAYSSDGGNWTEVNVSGIFGFDWINAIAYGNGKFVAGSSGKMAYSADGVTWTAVADSKLNGISAIAYGNGKFVAGGAGGKMAYSE